MLRFARRDERPDGDDGAPLRLRYDRRHCARSTTSAFHRVPRLHHPRLRAARPAALRASPADHAVVRPRRFGSRANPSGCADEDLLVTQHIRAPAALTVTPSEDP